MDRIYGERVYIRPITEEDTDLIIKWRNSDAVRPYFIYQKPFTREGHLNWLKTYFHLHIHHQLAYPFYHRSGLLQEFSVNIGCLIYIIYYIM